MNNRDRYYTLRCKKIALILVNLRDRKKATTAECSEAMGNAQETYMTYESGTNCPSLPELEGLAYFYDVPVEYFLGSTLLPNLTNKLEPDTRKKLSVLRNRKIAAIIRHSREQSGLDYQALSSRINIPSVLLEKYELCDVTIPLPDLELIANELHLTIDQLIDRHSPVGVWRKQSERQGQISSLPEDLQEFICQPINRPYLELAKKLSELSVERLRGVAEGLLEITF